MFRTNLHVLADILGEDVITLAAYLGRHNVIIHISAEHPYYTADTSTLLHFIHSYYDGKCILEKLEAYDPKTLEERDIQNTLLCRCDL